MLRKMCRYISAKCLCELCVEGALLESQQPPFSAQVSEVLAVVLDGEDDPDSQLSALHIVNDLLAKGGSTFDEQFTRLGIPSKILHLAKDASADKENEETDTGVDVTRNEEATNRKEESVKEESDVAASSTVVVPPEGSSVDREGLCN